MTTTRAELLLPKFLTDPDPNIYFSSNFVVLDFETTNADKGDPVNADNNVVLTCLGSPTTEAYVPLTYDFAFGYGEDLERILTKISEADFVIAHNAKFECGWLRRLGIDLTKVLVFDTQLAEYVLRGKSPKGFLTLDACLRRRGLGGKVQLISAMIKGGVSPEDIPTSWLSKYCGEDVRGAYELFLDQRSELFATGQEKVFYTKCLQTPVLADLEFNGMKLDKERVLELYERTEREYIEVERELSEVTGGINPNSPKQMGEFIYDQLGFAELKDKRGNPIRSANGNRRTGQDVIAALSPSNNLQRRFLDLKSRQGSLNAKLTKALTKFRDCVVNGDGILYASYNQSISATGRYTCTGKYYKVQLQNLDRDLKYLFKSRHPNWGIGEGDEAQLEFRAAIYLGQDPQGFEDIANNVDVHAMSSAIIGVSRQDAKAHTFKPLYGGVSGTKKERAYYQAFREKYKCITETQESWVDTALRTKCLVMQTGQRWRFDNIKLTSSGYIEGNTQVRNYPVQYLATAEIVPIALIYVWHAYKALKLMSFIVNTIHDSIISEVEPTEKEIYHEVTVVGLEQFPIQYMKKLYGIDFNVPLKGEIKVGSHWNEK